MLKELFSNRLFMGLLAIFILCVAGSLLYMRHEIQKGAEPEEGVNQLTEAPESAPQRVPIGDTSQGGHWHGDEWHADPHETHEVPARSVGKSYIPEGAAVTPDFPPVDPNEDPVAAAYKRLEYIKNNPYAWGGVHSERATQLIAQLMPPPVLIDHDHSDQVYALMAELIAQRDPRAAAVIIATLCEGSMSTDSMENALVAIGPPAVPYILPYLEKGVTEGGMVSSAVFDTLGSIAAEHPTNLGGITEHIIIPKILVIAADKDFDRHDSGTVFFATAALAKLQ